jgi:hypothetical protein
MIDSRGGVDSVGAALGAANTTLDIRSISRCAAKPTISHANRHPYSSPTACKGLIISPRMRSPGWSAPILLEENGERAVQRACYMTLETIAPLRATEARTNRPVPLESATPGVLLHHAGGQDLCLCDSQMTARSSEQAGGGSLFRRTGNKVFIMAIG